jgi:(S)-sulfolactate dehydrogenase
MGRELAGKRLGLVGYGAIARVTARMARGLGMSVAAYDPLLPADDAAWGETLRQSLPELLAASEVVSLHVPLPDATRDMIDAAGLAAMKRGAILVNAARGGVVDEAALVAALRSGHLGGAALDVFAREPVDAAAGALFAGVPNLILTPHIAGVTEESNVRVSAVTAAAVARHLGA